MRLLPGFAALALVSGCLGTPTSIFDRPAGPPPSGLAVTLSISPKTATSYLSPAITAASDSVAVWAEYEASGCLDYEATAGVNGGNTLVVTITERTSATVRYCLLGISTSIFRVVVRPAPRGSYPVVLRQRMEWSTDAPVERERVRGSATLP